MNNICFATNNKHKLEEINALLPDITITSLDEIGFSGTIPETGNTLEDNALQKAKFVWDKYHIPCFADDTGLEVPTLNNAPGVFSARYAGPEKNDAENKKLLLKNLQDINERGARFRTCISLVMDDQRNYLFEGIVNGTITYEEIGQKGFGYDALFKPIGYQQTFAEMSIHKKNSISHRAKAFQKLIAFLNKLS